MHTQQLTVYFIILIGGIVLSPVKAWASPVGVSKPQEKMKAMIFLRDESCVDDEIVKNVIAETFDLAVVIQVVSSSKVGEINNEYGMVEIQQRLWDRDAVAGLWFSCDSSPLLHMVSPINDNLDRHRDVGTTSMGINVELVSAIVRSWLEAVYEAWDAKRQSSPGRDESEVEKQTGQIDVKFLKEEVVSEGSVAIKETEIPSREQTAREPFKALKPVLWSMEVKGGITGVDDKNYAKIGALLSSFRLTNHLHLVGSVGAMLPITYEKYDVSITLRKRPILVGIDWEFSFFQARFFLGAGVETDFFGYEVKLRDEVLSEERMVQMSICAMASGAWRFYKKASLMFHLGMRTIIQTKIFDVEVNGEIQNVAVPWRLQPNLSIGMRFDIL